MLSRADGTQPRKARGLSAPQGAKDLIDGFIHPVSGGTGLYAVLAGHLFD